MRFLVRLESSEPQTISLDYRRRVISLMKRVLGVKEFIENPVRFYTFAVYFGKDASFEDEYIKNIRFINLRISTGDPKYGVMLYNGLMSLKGQTHRFNRSEFVIKSLKMEREGDWSKGQFKALSPVIVERLGSKLHDSIKVRYILPQEEGFLESLLENILRRFRSLKGYSPKVETFSFEHEFIKEEVVRHYGGYVRGFTGKFRILTDSQELLRFVYQYGIGLRTGQGFGYLEVG